MFSRFDMACDRQGDVHTQTARHTTTEHTALAQHRMVKTSHKTIGMTILGVPCYPIVNTKFDESSCSHSSNMSGAPKFNTGHMTSYHVLSGVVCNPYYRTWCAQLPYRSWSSPIFDLLQYMAGSARIKWHDVGWL